MPLLIIVVNNFTSLCSCLITLYRRRIETVYFHATVWEIVYMDEEKCRRCNILSWYRRILLFIPFISILDILFSMQEVFSEPFRRCMCYSSLVHFGEEYLCVNRVKCFFVMSKTVEDFWIAAIISSNSAVVIVMLCDINWLQMLIVYYFSHHFVVVRKQIDWKTYTVLFASVLIFLQIEFK